MRIGILTFQHGINFGAQLQCFAMQEILKAWGHQPEIIQLQFDNRLPVYRGNGIKEYGIRYALRLMLLRLLYASKMRKRFEIFKKKYLNLSAACSVDTIANVANTYDAIITGSDQIWGWGTHEHACYFIGWKPEFQGLRISYAPCCAKNYIKEQNKTKITALLNRYDAISVRNKETLSFVRDLTGKTPPIVADPTFLIDFKKYTGKRIAPYEKYILTYILGTEINGGHQALLDNIRKSTGDIPIVAIILTENKPMTCPWADKVYWAADPMEWMNLLYYASFVYTDSFHAAVFALKFHKRFIAYYAEEARASRFIDMASRYQIDPCIVIDVNDAIARKSFDYTPDYQKTDSYIQEQVDFSLDFLSKSLKTK